MTRIVCKTPSTGRPITVASNNIQTVYTNLISAPDFSVPDPSQKFPERDPLDVTRAIRPGEIFFLTPLSARNKDTVDRWIEVEFITENGQGYQFGRVEVRAGDTVFVPLQGRSLFKRSPSSLSGDALVIRADATNVFDVWCTAEERLANEHIGVE